MLIVQQRVVLHVEPGEVGSIVVAEEEARQRVLLWQMDFDESDGLPARILRHSTWPTPLTVVNVGADEDAFAREHASLARPPSIGCNTE